MIVKQNISLKDYNTFGIDVIARKLIEVRSTAELQEAIKSSEDFIVLSGGSNILITRNIEQDVIYVNSKGISTIYEDDHSIELKVQAGENWHEFVLWCIEHNYGGIENLSLIPGNVGTSPIQNIGAYGVEVKDVITQVEVIERTSGKIMTFSNAQCKFDYRDSIFKNELKSKVVVSAVSFKLTKMNHQINTRYGAIEDKLATDNILSPNLRDISNAVIAIRKSKLPDPKEIGNSGSFFKNPVVSNAKFSTLKDRFPDIPGYEVSETHKKVPAGWLIERAGFKGQRFGDAGVHKNQALVLVNYGTANGDEIYSLAKRIQKEILTKFNIALEMEVNII